MYHLYNLKYGTHEKSISQHLHYHSYHSDTGSSLLTVQLQVPSILPLHCQPCNFCTQCVNTFLHKEKRLFANKIYQEVKLQYTVSPRISYTICFLKRVEKFKYKEDKQQNYML